MISNEIDKKQNINLNETSAIKVNLLDISKIFVRFWSKFG